MICLAKSSVLALIRRFIASKLENAGGLAMEIVKRCFVVAAITCLLLMLGITALSAL